MPEISPETILNLPLEVNIVAAIFAFAGILLLIMSFSRLRQRYLVSAGIYGILSSGLVVIAIVLIACSINLYTYSRIIYEQEANGRSTNSTKERRVNLMCETEIELPNYFVL